MARGQGSAGHERARLSTGARRRGDDKLKGWDNVMAGL